MRTYNGEFLGRPELEALGVTCGGDDVRIHASSVIINPEGLRVGNHIRIDPFCILSATGSIELGDHVHIGGHCTLMGGGGIVMGDFSGFSHGVRVFSATDDLSGRHAAGPTVPEAFRGVRSARVELKRYAAVGAGTVILPGVTFGQGAVVGANSYVRKNLPEWTIWFGNPARRIGNRRKDVLDLEPLVIRAVSGNPESE